MRAALIGCREAKSCDQTRDSTFLFSSDHHGGNEAHGNGIQEGDYDGEETVDSEESTRSCTQCSELILERKLAG